MKLFVSIICVLLFTSLTFSQSNPLVTKEKTPLIIYGSNTCHYCIDTKLFLKEVGTGEISDIYNEMEQVTINTIKEAHIVGFKEYKSKTIIIGSKYRTYTVLEFLYGKANKILISQIKNNALLEGSVSASKAFQDLEKEIQGN